MEFTRLRAQLRAQIILLFTRYHDDPKNKSNLISAEALLKFGESSGLLTELELHELRVCLARLTPCIEDEPEKSTDRESSGALAKVVSKMVAELRQFKQEMHELIEAYEEAVAIVGAGKGHREIPGLILDRAFYLVNRARSEGLIDKNEYIDLVRKLHARSMPTP